MSLMVVVEGDTDIPVVRLLAEDAGLEIASILDMQGKSQLDARLESFNAAAQGSPWFVLRDLGEDAACGAGFVERCGIAPAEWMTFRIAVHQMESWLLADAEGIATFLGVQRSKVPTDPDAEKDPTRALVNLARSSRRASTRKAMVPTGRGAQVGPLYEQMIIEFASTRWSLSRASASSASLRRARVALRDLGRRWAACVSGACVR